MFVAAISPGSATGMKILVERLHLTRAVDQCGLVELLGNRGEIAVMFQVQNGTVNVG